MKILSPVLLSFTLGITSAAPVQQVWVNRYSLDSSRTNVAVALAIASDGSSVVGGSSAGTNGDLDYVVIKYTSVGQQLWLTRYDSQTNGDDQLRGMALDGNGNVFITGTSKTIMFNSGGVKVWTAPYGGRALAADANRNCYVTGFSELDYATVKLDANGSNLWLRTFSYLTSTNEPDVSQVIAVGSSGIVAVSGSETHFLYEPSGTTATWTRTVVYDSEGNQLWSANTTNGATFQSAHAVGIAVDASARVTVADGVDFSYQYDTTLYDTNGSISWYWNLDKDAHVGYTSTGQSMVTDTSGSVYWSGWRQLGDVCLTVKITNGHKAWISTYHGDASGRNQGNAITVDSAGNIYVAAYSPGTNSGNDIVTLKYDNNGNQLWVQRYDGPAHGDDIPTAIAVDNQGGVYVTGYSVTTNGGTEFVTIKYAEQNVKRNNDGSIQLTFFSTPGQASAFYGSTDFLTWSNLGFAIADANGLVQFTDTNAPSFNYRFYKRTIVP